MVFKEEKQNDLKIALPKSEEPKLLSSRQTNQTLETFRSEKNLNENKLELPLGARNREARIDSLLESREKQQKKMKCYYICCLVMSIVAIILFILLLIFAILWATTEGTPAVVFDE